MVFLFQNDARHIAHKSDLISYQRDFNKSYPHFIWDQKKWGGDPYKTKGLEAYD